MKAINVHVHLFYGADPRYYRPGENIGCLYGYHHAESPEFALTYSRDARDGKVMRTLRRGLKTVLGFDFIHTWRNREEILRSDVVWTHTEHEHLSVALLLLLKGRRQGGPVLLAQSVWLIDKWPEFGALRRWAYRKLLARADMLTTLASENAQLMRQYFRREVTQVYYGLNMKDFPLQEPRAWRPGAPVRIAAIGNDRDRDWNSLVEAFRLDSRYEVRIATRRRVPRALHAENVRIAPATGLKAARELYDWADVIVVPLRANSHASGITVVLEAVALGKPLIVTDVGALRDYFGPEHVSYVPPHDVAALRSALETLVADPALALSHAQAASRHFVERDFTTHEFAMQHARITRDFLRRRTVQGAPHAADHAASHAGAHAAGQARASEGAATSLNRVARSKP
ncbi:Glycosyltransferase [Caballeronia glathei]|jgi:glycosyltransferase involved in cell wall biosynthesis|uniref:Glycosyl transferase n=1 Tax=Caballeronia glathei TaxID=60547 RepID=A0A069PM00_9BURK|nr:MULTISPECIES: glycosyltransferase family 4 protein [Burkholderiaceae]KDR41625.1 glycosyl transferase [Caballeronia glathei]TCK42773.1 glycosyltransferase involved in cell wall biosynthesis [Paraburkholderia sp. BL8N3]CDY75876.1 Glycosyltransferase [Caballeronia glathei]